MAKKKVRPIPKEYHVVTPGLCVQNVPGFIAFCKKVFGAKVPVLMKGPGNSIMHAEVAIGDSRIMVGEEMPGWPTKSAKTLGGASSSLYVYVPKCDAIFKKALAAGASVRMPCTDMFWGDRYGQVEDPFGNVWGIATHVEDVPPKEMTKRGKAWMKSMAEHGGGA
jgi:PhnB protein